MIIEVLYPEIGNLFGDLGNVRYLEKCAKCKIINTSIFDKPTFLDKKVDLVYMGAMSEGNQDLVISVLKKYKKEIKQKINEGQHFLITGSSLEIFGNYILNPDGSKVEGLSIFDFYSKRDFEIHHASHVLARFKDIDVVGHKSQFSHSFGHVKPFLEVIKGVGFDGKKGGSEGIHYKNFYATYLVGPLLIQNPLLADYLLKELKIEHKLAFEKDIMKCYKVRLSEYKDERMKY